jgi:hypothetical protein
VGGANLDSDTFNPGRDISAKGKALVLSFTGFTGFTGFSQPLI